MSTEPATNIDTFPPTNGSSPSNTQPSLVGVPQGAMSLSAGGGGSVGGSVNPTTPTTTTTGRIEASQQLRDAEAYLGTLDADRADTCRELEDEAKLFLESPATPEQEKRFRLIYQLVRFHVHTQSHNRYSILQEKVACVERVQEAIGGSVDEAAFKLEESKALMIAVTKGKILEATIRVIERGLEAMRELNGRSAASRGRGSSSAPSGWKHRKDDSGVDKTALSSSAAAQVTKRSRLPAAAVKEMRTWLDKHWDDPVPTHEEKAGFAQRHEITTKQVENWFINIRMREWRPAMRRALDHAEETGSYAEFSRLLQHTADGNVFKKFLEDREMGNGSTLVPPPSLQRFIGAEGFAAFVGDRPHKRQRN